MMPGSLRALLANVIDYAGLYPPASLPLDVVLMNYQRYLASPQAWMLNRLVLPEDKFDNVTPGPDWRISLLVNRDPGPLAPQVETLESKSPGRLSLPTYCEVPLDQVGDGYAKIRTTNPSPEVLAGFLCSAAARRKAFKATAGLHHPLRSETMHGFLNLLIGATFAWTGMKQPTLTGLLADSRPGAFQFDDEGLQWGDWRASTIEVEQARREFAHSFGSCSFEEPVDDLRAMGLFE